MDMNALPFTDFAFPMCCYMLAFSIIREKACLYGIPNWLAQKSHQLNRTKETRCSVVRLDTNFLFWKQTARKTHIPEASLISHVIFFGWIIFKKRTKRTEPFFGSLENVAPCSVTDGRPQQKKAIHEKSCCPSTIPAHLNPTYRVDIGGAILSVYYVSMSGSAYKTKPSLYYRRCNHTAHCLWRSPRRHKDVSIVYIFIPQRIRLNRLNCRSAWFDSRCEPSL